MSRTGLTIASMSRKYLDTFPSPSSSGFRTVEATDESFEGLVDKLVVANDRDQFQPLQILRAGYRVKPDEDMVHRSTEKLILAWMAIAAVMATWLKIGSSCCSAPAL
jgi:hypothetical protein